MNEDDLFELAQTLEKLKDKLPYHINVIDSLGGANENANTKILCELLKYKENENYPILNSFLYLIKNKSTNASFTIKEPHIEYGKEYIDGLIEDKTKDYGIIIENKIHNARDQYLQIERYINTVKEHGVAYKNIYVVYLTRDSNKEIENYSLTSIAKEYLGVTNNDNGRFIQMNYRDDILPWLKTEILPNCKIKENCLRSAIEQYVDYLEGIFGLRKSKESNEINRIMKEQLYHRLKLTESSTTSQQYNELKKTETSLEQLKQRVYQFRKSIKNRVCASFIQITEDFFGKIGYIGIKNCIESHNFFFIYYENWSSNVHFEWLPLNIDKLVNGDTYTLHLHTERNDSFLKEKLLQDEEFKRVIKGIADIDIHVSHKFTVFKKDYKTNKSFANMTYEQQKNFLEGAYKEIMPIIPIIDRLLETTSKGCNSNGN